MGFMSVVGTVFGAVVGFALGGPGGAVAGAMKGAAIGGTVGGIVDALIAPTVRQNKPSFDRSTTYGFDVRNTIDPTTPIAVRYGEHLAQAHIISSHITQLSKKKQAISVLCGLGEGEIDSVSDIRLDGASIWDTVTDHPCDKKGNAKRSLFDIEQGYLDEPSLVVKVAGTTKTLTTDYTLGGTDKEPTIQFTHDAIPADGAAVTYSVRFSPMAVKATLRTGTSAQSAIPAFQEVAQTQTINKSITNTGGGYTWRTKRKVEDLVVHIVCPYGLIHYWKGKDAGKTSEFYTAFNIEVRTVTDAGVTGDWVHILGNNKRAVNTADDKDNKPISLTFVQFPTDGPSPETTYTGEFGLSGETTSAVRYAFRLTDYLYNEREDKFPGWSTPTRVDVRVTKTAKDYTGEEASRLINEIALEHITEVTYDKLTYPYTALLGLEGIANDQLSGAFPEITIQGKWRKTVDLSAATAAAWSDSFPWAVADILTDARYGLGQWFTSSDIDTASFDTWATFCETSVTDPDGQSSQRYRFDGAVDAGEVAVDSLRRMCALAQGLLVWYEGTWSMVVDTTTSSVFAFTDGSDGTTPNIVDGSVKWNEPTEEAPNVLIGQFQNRDNDWEPDTLTLEDRASLDDGDPIVERTISCYGLSRPAEVARALDYCLKSTKHSRITVSWESRVIGTKVAPGDVVTLTNDAAGWSAKEFRVLGAEWTSGLTVRFIAREYSTSVYGTMDNSVQVSTKRTSVPAVTAALTSSKTYPTQGVTGLTLKELDD